MLVVVFSREMFTYGRFFSLFYLTSCSSLRIKYGYDNNRV